MTTDKAPSSRPCSRSGSASTTSTPSLALRKRGQPLPVHRPPRADAPAPTTARRARRGGLQGHHAARRPDPRLPGRRRGRQPARLHGHRRGRSAASSAPSTTSSRGTDGEARYQTGGGNRIPLGENTLVPAKNGKTLTTTIDLDLQWFTQRVLNQTLEQYRAKSGVAIVMDSRTGELMALADAPTFNANKPLEADEDDLGSRAINDAYEPGSVEKVLTVASLIDAGKVTPRTKLRIPSSLPRQDRVDRRLVRRTATSGSRSPASSPSRPTSAPSSPPTRSARSSSSATSRSSASASAPTSASAARRPAS